MNGGTCKGGINMVTCMCAPGYTGQNCEMSMKILRLIKQLKVISWIKQLRVIRVTLTI